MTLNAASRQNPQWLLVAWGLLAGLLLVGCFVLVWVSPFFDWQREVFDMPAAYLGFGMLFAGLCYGLLVPLIARSLQVPVADRRILWWGACVVGLVARGVLLFSEPALEDDYYRYLWEGALSARLINAYRVTPAAARQADPATAIGRLAQSGDAVLMRVNHPNITSNYPPVAQAAFAVAHLIAPWNLTFWRLLVLAFDSAAWALLIGLLGMAGRDRLWSLLYWWNPLVIKEFANSAHMDALIVMLVLGSLFLSARRWHLPALGVASLAIGAKLWPVLLVPLLLRPWFRRPWLLISGVVVVVGMTVLWLAPSWWGGPNPDDGYVAYARLWRTNSAAFPAVENVIGAVLLHMGWKSEAWLVARGVIGAGLMAFAIWTAIRGDGSVEDLCRRAGLIVLALLLMSPSQFPWYVIWLIPFAPFQGVGSVVVMTTLVPLYYVSFHYISRGNYAFFANVIVWLEWVPVWLAVTAEFVIWKRRAS